MRLAATFLLGLSLCGCAGQQEMRQLAGDSAAALNDYRRQMTVFAERQTALNTGTQMRVQNLAQDRELLESETQRRLLSLEVAGDKPATDAYRLLTAVSAQDILGQSQLLRAEAPVAAAPSVTFDAGSAEQLTRQLTALSRSPTFAQRLTRILAYGEELRDEYSSSLQAAATETTSAAAEGVAADAAQRVPDAAQGGPQ